MCQSIYQVEVDRQTATSWTELLDLFTDANLYQTWAYGAVRWGQKNLSHLVIRKEGEVLSIAQLRIVRPVRLRFGIAYLRWGPLLSRQGRQIDPEDVAYIAGALENEYVRKRGLLLRVLPNAFVGSERAALIQSKFSSFRSEPPRTDNVYRTFVVDLAQPAEQLRKKLDKKWRNTLSRAEKNELDVLQGNGIEEYRVFCKMYREMLKRKGFETTVSVKQFEQIQEALPDNHRMETLICLKAGVPVAGIVSSVMGDSAIYLLGATSDGGLTANGGYLLQWTWIQKLKERGIRWYDLGGISPERNQGVYKFKRGLSGVDSCHITPLIACNDGLSSAIIIWGAVFIRAMLGYARNIRTRVPGVSQV
jgi:lipid II:glycine glycyltransferase (peptidoglycan interpeptide bridge formation enzyme)